MIKVELTYYKLRITINGLLHLSINRSDIVSIQSWYSNDNLYYIEYQTKDTTIECNYDNRKIWENILKELVKIGIA